MSNTGITGKFDGIKDLLLKFIGIVLMAFFLLIIDSGDYFLAIFSVRTISFRRVL